MQQPVPLPIGTRLVIDEDTVFHPGDTVYGGSPGRLLRLNPKGRTALNELRDGVVRTPAGAVLGRRLSDAGLLHPLPATCATRTDLAGSVTVVIPVLDRAAELDACVRALLTGDVRAIVAAVIVVDDGSRDPGALAAVLARHDGVRLVRRSVNGGPGAARNTGLAQVRTQFVAFCDSDCLPSLGWIEDLVGHFDDPLVAAVAPRIVAAPGSGRPPDSLADRFAHARQGLDLGARPARVAPMTRVSYVPTAALLLRRSALDGVAGAPGFEESLRYGEDVDLVWRLIEAGWRVRYDPRALVEHVEPRGWRALLARRYAYGTSAAPLAERHPGTVSPLILVAAPALTVAALLARRPRLAAAAFAAGYVEAAVTVTRAGRPISGIAGPLARGVRETFVGSGRWASQFAAPVAVAALAAPSGSARTRAARSLAILGLLSSAPLRDWARIRPPITPAVWTAASWADDAAYGAGVWAGCLRARRLDAVLPQWRWQLLARPKSSP